MLLLHASGQVRDWTRLFGSHLIVLFLVGLFTASVGGAQTEGRGQAVAPTNDSASPALAQKTKTPAPTKTRKPKKTKTPQPTATATAEPSTTPEPSATRKRRKTRTPTPQPTSGQATVTDVSATRLYTETPAPPDVNEFLVKAQQGGAFAFEEGSVRVNIPPRVFSKNARLVFRRILRHNHPNDRSGQVIVNRLPCAHSLITRQPARNARHRN